ncbi:MAG TPA: response regulator transcription factor [Sandaracinaceae bacterium LLY-WYZ-13_1]|nr:response regulator transcription factor [Sandaracinaceae bacterium LLY-WYZ-13_1]
MTPVRIFVADDHPVVVEGIERFASLEPALEVVGTAATADAIRPGLERTRPDVLSLDVQMPGMRGPTTVAAIADTGVPILLFTLHPVDDAIAALVRAGASGYLAKSSSLDAYRDAIRALHDGERRLPDALRARLAGPLQRPPEEVLTRRELDVFRRLAAGETVKEAAFQLGLSPSTVYTHAERVRRKLGVTTAAEMARYAASWDLDAG